LRWWKNALLLRDRSRGRLHISGEARWLAEQMQSVKAKRMDAKIHRGLLIKVDRRGNLGGSSISGADFHGAAAGKIVL